MNLRDRALSGNASLLLHQADRFPANGETADPQGERGRVYFPDSNGHFFEVITKFRISVLTAYPRPA
jgi:hypothetical protein